jgi:hypothetical protein
MRFKHVRTNKICFGKEKGALSVNIEIVMSEREFDDIFKEQYKDVIFKQAIKLNGI